MDYLSKLTHGFSRLYSKLIPIPCLLCGTPNKNSCLCHACISQLPLLGSACPRCASPLQQSRLCGQCLTNPPEQDASFSLFRYKLPINSLIADLKYHDKLVLSQFFATQMTKHLKERELPFPQLLIPIPLYPSRLRERGYNQSLELARHLSQQLSIPVRHDTMHRIRDTKPQASLPFSQRKNNMKSAFIINHTDLPSHIALIDDVLTTGHTANVAAKLLRRHGVSNIEVWTIARTLKNEHSR